MISLTVSILCDGADHRQTVFSFPLPQRQTFFFLVYQKSTLPDKKMKFKFAPQSSPQIPKTELPALSSPSPPSKCAHMLHLSRHLVKVASLQSPPPSLVPINHHEHHRNNGLRKPQLGRARACSHHCRGFHVKTSMPASPEIHRWRGALGEAGGKACPSRLSKYPAGSPQEACGHSLNSFKVPFICSKSRTVFVQGLLLLDKSLAPVQD